MTDPFATRYRVVLLVLILLTLCTFSVSLMNGSVALSVSELIGVLTGKIESGILHDVIWNLRLPRTLLALQTGLHFALSGLILQSITRNPLADPSVVGVSGGASLAVVIFLLLLDTINDWLSSFGWHVSMQWLPLAAIVGGFSCAFFVVLLSLKNNLRPVELTLNGVAVGAIANAIVMWLVITRGGSGDTTEITVLWLAGSLYARDFVHVYYLLPWTLFGLIALLFLHRPMSLLRFNALQAKTMGLGIMFWRVVGITVAVIFAASAISVSGPIGFVGLIVPHITRLFIGGDIRKQIWVSILVGANLTLIADIIGRTWVSPIELPAGALTTIIGIPLLLYLLQKQMGQLK